MGASTGGFTHVLCERGARRVYAVDVGYGQLDARLRDDPRVVVLERTNARYLTRAEVPEPVDLIVCDASFIGLRTVLPAPLALAAPRWPAHRPHQAAVRGRAWPRGQGRYRPATPPPSTTRVCATIGDWLAAEGWPVTGLVESPIKGRDGNTEFLITAWRRP